MTEFRTLDRRRRRDGPVICLGYMLAVGLPLAVIAWAMRGWR